MEIRAAEESDFSTILSLITANSEYLGIKPAVISVEQLIEDCLKSSPPKFYCLVCVSDNRVVGYTIYNIIYSTRCGRNLFIQEFYLVKGHRPAGQEKFLKALVSIASEKGCLEIKWQVPMDADEYRMFWRENGAIDHTAVNSYHIYKLKSEDF